jgi:alpha-L-fucosidase 2
LNNREKLWYLQPAKLWVEALPIGNGRLGGMIFGHVQEERIQLNEDSIWYGGPKDGINPDGSRHLEGIREMLFEGKVELKVGELVIHKFDYLENVQLF